MKILVVDDEAGIREICRRALTAEGHEVVSCCSGDEALPRLGEGWDLVLSDVSMPGRVGGNELLRRARHETGAEVALMTACPTVESSVAALKDGACDYLLKPFALDALLDLVRRRAEGRPRAVAIEPRRQREATILFADIRGFTAYSEKVSPEEAAAALDERLAMFVEAVRAEGGTINKLIGDGAMAVFGLPLPHADPAGAAARAALRARDAVARLGGLRFGFGINSGLVAAGRLGVEGGAEYGVIGAPVNVASRLEGAAGAGAILAGPAAAALLAGRFTLGPERSLALDGLREPVAASPVLG